MSKQTAVTIAMKKINRGDDKISQPLSKLESQFQIEMANTFAAREKVFRLAYQIYDQKGFIQSPLKTKLLVSDFDFLPDTSIIYIKDKHSDEIVASLTINFSNHAELPSYEIFKEEIDTLKKSHGSMAEVTRLVIKEGHRYSSLLLARLFHAAFLYCYQVKKVKSFIIGVNPSHVCFYQKILGFEVMGEEKSCNRVNGAPARLLLLNLENIDANINRFYENKLNVTSKYKFFKFAIPASEARQLANSLRNSFKPMGFLERKYFSIISKPLLSV